MLNNFKSSTIVSFGTELQLRGTAAGRLLQSDFLRNPEGEPFDRLNKIKQLDKLRIQLANDAFQKDKVVIYSSKKTPPDNLTLLLYRHLNAGKVFVVQQSVPTSNFFVHFNNNLLKLRGKMAREIALASNQHKFKTILEKFIPPGTTNN